MEYDGVPIEGVLEFLYCTNSSLIHQCANSPDETQTLYQALYSGHGHTT